MNILDALKAIPVKKDNGSVGELKTPWTDQITADHVWQEYPRPQMVRDSYINLNGLWNYSIANTHLSIPDSLDRIRWDGKILVPFSPEAPLSGVKRQLKPGQTLCYQRDFALGTLSEGRLLLHFGAVDQRCRVCINEKLVGNHEGGYLPFTLDITDAIVPGKNTILILCQDDSDKSYHTRGKQMLKRGGMFYTAQSGIWQTVWMEWVPDLYIEDLRLTPGYDQSQIGVSLSIAGPVAEKEVVYRAQVTSKGQRVAVLSTESPDFAVAIPDFIPWSPENPHLYDLAIDVCNAADPAQIIDHIDSYFAMRCVSVETDPRGIARLCLNHRPYFQNGLLDQGYWPDGLMTAPCDEAFIYDIQTMKDLGFNMLRKHCKLEPLRWYYHCDRLGMLVWQDIVNGGTTYNMIQVCYAPTVLPKLADRGKESLYATGRTAQISRDEWYRECQTTMEHLYNCPSIVNWVLFNEGWGQFETEKATAFAQALDETRTFDQASGWFDHQGGDMKSIHNYFRELVCPPTNTVSEDENYPRFTNLCGLRAAVISEYGGLALPLPGHITTNQVFGYKNLKSTQEFQERFRDMIHHIRSLEPDGLSAAVYTQVSDIEDEVNGLLTYDRRINKVTAK